MSMMTLMFAAVAALVGTEPVDRVNCFIGTGGTGHCFPAATYPFGLVQAGPDTGWGSWDYCSGYRYEDRQITMFSQTHNPGGGCPDYADVGLMPFVGNVSTNVVSPFSHANETASPGYYAVTLDRGNIRVEVSATERASIYRITAPEAENLRLLVDLDYGMGNLTWAKKTVKPLKVERRADGAIRAHLLRNGFVKGRHIGVELKFSPAPVSVEELPAEPGVHAPKFVLSFGRPADGRLIVKCGLSVTDGEGAARNLAQEIPGWDFDAVRLAARQKWREVLSRIEVEDDDADRAAMFATAVYRLFHVPTNIADIDGLTRGGDGKLLRMPNGRYYSELSLWDTFRGAHPLYTLVAAEYVPDFVNSMVAHQKAVGFLPVLPKWGRDSQCMIATHAVAVIADAYFKGFGGVDWPAAYETVRATLRETHPTRGKENWDLLDAYGYYPCDKLKGEGVSRTLECSYDDWCAWKMAETLGTPDDVAFFRKRAHNWTNVLDRATGFMRGRKTDGTWREPFDPYRCGHESSWTGDFTEGNAWQWRWHVLQDPAGLVAALGGKARAAALLDELFSLPSDLDSAHTSPDVTGLLGQYVQGNEPSHHIPYLYQYAGRGDRAAERIRQLCEKFYFNRPDGLCGNEDHGEMSAWYVFASLGFYPVNPSSGEYVIGAPQVKKATLRLPGGKTLTIEAKNLSKENLHVKSVTRDGRPLEGFVLRHADLLKGGSLVFEMTRLPTGCPNFVVERPRAAATPRVVRAADFGLDAKGEKNAAAISRALAEAKRLGASHVELAPGTYRCFDEPGIVIEGFRDFTFDGKGAVLVFRRPAEYRGQPQSELILDKGNVLVRGCERTEVRNFTLDWDWEKDPLAAFVRVTAKHEDAAAPENSYVEFTFVDWERYPKYPEPVPVQKMMAMTEDRMHFRRGPAFSFGQTEGHFGAKNEWVKPNVLRVWPGLAMEGRNQNPMVRFGRNPAANLARVRQFEQNGLYRLQHCYYGKNAVNLADNRHLAVRHVSVWSTFGMAMVTDGRQRFTEVEDFTVMPPTREAFAAAYPGVTFRPRPVSSTSDGFHVARSQGYFRLLNCRWTLNNDDSINFHDRFTIAVRGGDRVLDVINRRGAEYFRVEKGAEIELRYPNFAETGFRAKVTRIAGNRLYLDRTIPPQKGQCFLVWDRTYGTDNVHVKGCVFEDSGFRNIFSPSNLTIEDCTFRRTNANPICFIADYRSDLWCEGMGATNLVVRNCHFEDVNRLKPEKPVISAVCVTPTDWDVGKVDPGFVGGNVLIENCRFVRPTGPAVKFTTGSDVQVRNVTVDVRGVDLSACPEAGKMMFDGAVDARVEGVRWLDK